MMFTDIECERERQGCVERESADDVINGQQQCQFDMFTAGKRICKMQVKVAM